MNSKEFSFPTDTATLCVFDPLALKHRLNDDADWWTISEAELFEVNEGNVAFFGLGSDGVYRVLFGNALSPASKSINIRVPSGKVFIGAAEEVTSGGFEPEGLRGVFFNLRPGNYTVSVGREGDLLLISVVEGGVGRNDFVLPVSIS